MKEFYFIGNKFTKYTYIEEDDEYIIFGFKDTFVGKYINFNVDVSDFDHNKKLKIVFHTTNFFNAIFFDNSYKSFNGVEVDNQVGKLGNYKITLKGFCDCDLETSNMIIEKVNDAKFSPNCFIKCCQFKNIIIKLQGSFIY